MVHHLGPFRHGLSLALQQRRFRSCFQGVRNDFLFGALDSAFAQLSHVIVAVAAYIY